MKQHITLEQYRELESKEASKWVDWCIEREYDFSKTPNIGQMIEFLASTTISKKGIWVGWLLKSEGVIDTETLCDDLWQEVKKELESH